MRGLVPKFIMLICLLHINFRPFDPCERVLTQCIMGGMRDATESHAMRSSKPARRETNMDFFCEIMLQLFLQSVSSKYLKTVTKRIQLRAVFACYFFKISALTRHAIFTRLVGKPQWKGEFQKYRDFQ